MTEVANASLIQSRVAGAYARAEGLVRPGPVPAVDPVRQRFQLVEGGQSARKGGAAPVPGVEDTPSAPRPAGDKPAQERGPGLLGALTSFLAKMFSQEPAAEASASTAINAHRAYSDVAGAVIIPPSTEDIVIPGFPRLASGRALDLTV